MFRSLLLVMPFVSLSYAALPPEAAELKVKREAKIAEIDRTYVAELEKLQKKAMAAGNLAVANEIQKEISEVTHDPFSEENTLGKSRVTPEILTVGEWRLDVKKPAYTTHLRFAPNQDVFERGKASPVGKWFIRNGKIRMDFKYSWNEFSQYYSGAVVLRESRSSDGKRDGVTLTQIKP